ncbi:hypothetical protein NB636_02025 [Oxalobacter aliiformigenes]|uniref:hypothetical protein n=1 Tax=Oxalobacter aliiformigenes TaxID=2946593 RepID=UPI0022AEB727|nr:hypothetical protein [Oxalobacter aliiformigenes]MCZ4065460.1 hypothetical protein [Oxalobacter aliiformigenes]WAV99665.1 hypothetical protein NB636_02025 [Oxalobacter aliiformigenes]
MSDFLKGVGIGLAGIGNGANGIARAVQSLSMAPYAAALKEQQARSAAAVQALNEAKLQDIRDRRTANDYWARQINVPTEALGGYSPSEVAQILKNTRAGQMMQAAGMLQPRGDGLDDIRESVRSNIARDEDALRRLGQDSAFIERATNGGEIYQYKNNGAAFDPFYGSSRVADPEVRNLYRQEKQAAITQKRAQAAKASRSGSSSGGQWETFDENGIRYQRNKNTGKVARVGKVGEEDVTSESAEMKEYREVRARAEKRGDTATVRALDETARAMGLI